MILTLLPFVIFVNDGEEPLVAVVPQLPETVNGVVTLNQDVKVRTQVTDIIYGLNSHKLMFDCIYDFASFVISENQDLTFKYSFVATPDKRGP